MPVLRTSASDFTAWSRANAILPANGKAAKSTDTTVDRKAAAVVAIGSQSAIGATPSSAIAKRWRIVPAVPLVKATLTNSSGTMDSFIAKYNSSGTVQWVAKQSGAANDRAYGVAADSSSNLIMVGYFTSTTLTLYNANGTVGKTLTNSAASNRQDGFIVKYNSAGTIQSVAQLGGELDDQTLAVTVDLSGNVIVAGYSSSFSSPTFYNAGGDVGAAISNPSGGEICFIVKYNPAGTVQWAARQAGGGYGQAYCIAVDSSGNIIIAGYGNPATLTLYNANGTPFGTTFTNSGGFDSFIAKYDSAGTVLWGAKQSGTLDDQTRAVTADSSGNVIMAGYFASTTLTLYNANGTPFGTTLTNTGNTDSFIVKYDSAGTVQWVAQQGGATSLELPYSVAVDSSGNVIMVGFFVSTTLTLYNANGTPFGTTLTRGAGGNGFIAKYNSAGTVQWVAQQGGTGDIRDISVTVDSSGNIIVTGYFSFGITLYNANGTPFGTTLTNPGNDDSFVVKYNSAGTVLWAAKQGGTGNDYGCAITSDSSGNVIVGGYFDSTTLTCYNVDGTDIITPEIPSSIAYYR